MKVSNFLGKIAYNIVLALSKLITHTIFIAKVHGRENVDQKEPFIFCSNHLSLVDPVILVGSVLKRVAYFMGKKELYEKKFFNWFYRSLNSFPVARGTADMGAIRTSVKCLKEGNDMMIFPEGTRNPNQDGKIMELHSGVAMIALQSKCNIIPCYIDSKGGYKAFRRFNVNIGKPIDINEFLEEGFNKENLSKITTELRNKMETIM